MVAVAIVIIEPHERSDEGECFAVSREDSRVNDSRRRDSKCRNDEADAKKNEYNRERKVNMDVTLHETIGFRL